MQIPPASDDAAIDSADVTWTGSASLAGLLVSASPDTLHGLAWLFHNESYVAPPSPLGPAPPPTCELSAAATWLLVPDRCSSRPQRSEGRASTRVRLPARRPKLHAPQPSHRRHRAAAGALRRALSSASSLGERRASIGLLVSPPHGCVLAPCRGWRPVPLMQGAHTQTRSACSGACSLPHVWLTLCVCPQTDGGMWAGSCSRRGPRPTRGRLKALPQRFTTKAEGG